MSQLPKCPKCECEYTYEDGSLIICPECFHEFNADSIGEDADEVFIVKDAHGTILSQGDDVTIIKTLKIKGAQDDLKMGTKVKNIRLVQDSDHNIDCRIKDFGVMALKSEFVKKV